MRGEAERAEAESTTGGRLAAVMGPFARISAALAPLIVGQLSEVLMKGLASA